MFLDRVYVTGYSRGSDSNPLVLASGEPTVEQEDTDGDDDNISNTHVKSEPDDSEYFNGVSRDVEMSNENEELSDRQGDEDFLVSEESVTSKNLHEVAGACTGGPVILTEEEVFQQTHLGEVNVTDNGIEGSIDNNDCNAYSKPTSTSTMMGLCEQEEIKEKNLPSDVVGDNIDYRSNDIHLLREDHMSGVNEADKGQLFNEEGTPAPMELKGQNQSNSDSGPNTDISCISPYEPPSVKEIQETAFPHETWEDKPTSDCAHGESMETQGKEKQKAVTTGLKVFLCKHCVKSFSTALDMELHEESHSEEKAFSCKQCGKVLLTKESLVKHEMIHKEAKPFVCKYCEKKFTSRSTLWEHRKLHLTENSFHCNDCEKKFSSRQVLKEHEKFHAREKDLNEQTTFICKYCKEEFGDRADWLAHEQTHTSKKLHKGKQCAKNFNQQRVLSLHENMHTKPRNFKCSHCEKRFSRNRELTDHEMTHTGEDFVSVECVTSEEGNLHEEAGGSIIGGPVIVTEEEVIQQTHLDEVNVTDDGIEGSIDNNDGTAHSKPTSVATLTLERMGLSECETIEENNHTRHTVENCIDYHSNGTPILRQDMSGVTGADKGQLFYEEDTPVPVEMKGQNLSNLEGRPNTVISGNLPCEPIEANEIQETSSPHETWEDKTTSDSVLNEIVETQGKEKQKAVTTGLKVFLCKHCVKSFSTALDLEEHEHSHANNEKGFSCKKCGKVLRKQENLVKHEMMHKEEKPFVCKYCEKKFTSRSTLWRHRKLHMTENSFHCSDCEKKFNNRQALMEHEKVHAREKAPNDQTAFSCKYCKKEFGDKADWLAHEQTHTSKELHKGKQCAKNFNQQRALSLHEKTHTVTRKFKCSHCEKRFSCKQDLTYHEMIHTGEKPFQCNQCGKSFNQSSTLKTHMKIHTGEKSFQCNFCGEAFRHKFTLVHHERIHTNLKPYNCKYCNKTFNAKSSLKHHEWVHSEEKPFQCSHCDKAFSRKQILVRHERIHTGEKPYECKECEKRFNQRVALIQHQRVHTGDMPYKCKYCDKKFAWKGNYQSHEKIHTKKGAS
ncbi:hypothetical protein HOLleu_01978 [Holothuria leucospilota]|uniref:C2H2-type domain-containing protein n=1 Tax=Holothuria leucospilota TaxID=206669 RepID=A0A9Q1CR49_HOLLE|nr:hypothetical protein HOLleu_01978 [Holothuria leucospilota]